MHNNVLDDQASVPNAQFYKIVSGLYNVLAITLAGKSLLCAPTLGSINEYACKHTLIDGQFNKSVLQLQHTEEIGCRHFFQLFSISVCVFLLTLSYKSHSV